MFEQWLAIDAGNSRLKFGLFVPSRSSFFRRNGQTVTKIVDVAGEWPHCRRFLAIAADDPIPWRILTEWVPDAAVVAGSNPSAVERVLTQWPHADLPTPLAVRDRYSISLEVDVDFPDQVGLDRLLNAVAANALRPASRPAVVIDSGTATTVNFISEQGVFRGGTILPGLEMSAKALDHYTAALPLVPVQELGGVPPIVPGRNTHEAIRGGLYWGQVGAIREIVVQICRQQRLPEPDFRVNHESADAVWMILTGGGGPVLSRQFPGLLMIPSLGMHGLVLTAWTRNTSIPMTTVEPL